jgi:hypothetical protein
MKGNILGQSCSFQLYSEHSFQVVNICSIILKLQIQILKQFVLLLGNGNSCLVSMVTWEAEDHGSRPAWAKKFMRSHLNQQRGTEVCICYPATLEVEIGRTVVQSSQSHFFEIFFGLAKKVRPYLQNNQSKRGGRCGSSSRVPA